MNVLLISRCFPYPRHYGDRLIVSHLVEELRERGHCLDMAAFYLHDRDLDEIPRCKQGLAHFEPVKEHPRSWIDYLRRLFRQIPHSADQCWNPAMWRTIERLLSTRRYDLVHYFGGIQVYEFQNVSNRLPCIITPYESFALFLEREVLAATEWLKRLRLKTTLRVTRRYERRIYEQFDRVVLVSRTDADYLEALNPRLPTAVIPNGVDLQYFSPVNTGCNDGTLVFLGNYEYGPNLAAAVSLITDILPRVQAQMPKACVRIIGANPPASLLALARRDVDVTGWVADLRIPLAQAACMVVPLFRGAGIRNKILEAMAVGLPVVSTPCGCEGIEVTPGEDVLLGKDPEELALRAVQLLQQEALRVRLSKGGRRLVERLYSWRSVGDRYETLYHQVTALYQSRTR
jgi:glycosyltransferase involved in cell wall biosynthesis